MFVTAHCVVQFVTQAYKHHIGDPLLSYTATAFCIAVCVTLWPPGVDWLVTTESLEIQRSSHWTCQVPPLDYWEFREDLPQLSRPPLIKWSPQCPPSGPPLLHWTPTGGATAVMTSVTCHAVPAVFDKLFLEGSRHIQTIKMTNLSGPELLSLHVFVACVGRKLISPSRGDVSGHFFNSSCCGSSWRCFFSDDWAARVTASRRRSGGAELFRACWFWAKANGLSRERM